MNMFVVTCGVATGYYVSPLWGLMKNGRPWRLATLLSGRAARCALVLIQIIKQHVGHRLDSDDEALFVHVELRRVNLGRDASGLIADAQEIEEAWDDLQIGRAS